MMRCRGAADVARAFAHARATGLPVTARSGGHCFASRSTTTGVLIDLAPSNSVVLTGGLAVIGAGTPLSSVYARLAAHGLTLPAGCGPTVGIAGLTLGGGLGLLGRRYGLTCDRLRAAEVVLTDGTVLTCSPDREPDLFWALRGAGGGQFGVVTSLTFEPVAAERTTRFLLTWPLSAAADVVAVWQEVAPEAPDSVSAGLKVAASGVTVFGAGEPPEELLKLRPAQRDIRTMPYVELKKSFDDIGEDLGQVLIRSEFFATALPSDVVASLVDLRPGRELNFTPMGGAYNRVPATGTAFAHRGERFLLEHVAPIADAAWVHTSWATAHAHASGRVYPNFPDLHLTDPLTAYHGENLTRLRALKTRYDPDRLLNFPQSL